MSQHISASVDHMQQQLNEVNQLINNIAQELNQVQSQLASQPAQQAPQQAFTGGQQPIQGAPGQPQRQQAAQTQWASATPMNQPQVPSQQKQGNMYQNLKQQTTRPSSVQPIGFRPQAQQTGTQQAYGSSQAFGAQQGNVYQRLQQSPTSPSAQGQGSGIYHQLRSQTQ